MGVITEVTFGPGFLHMPCPGEGASIEGGDGSGRLDDDEEGDTFGFCNDSTGVTCELLCALLLALGVTAF